MTPIAALCAARAHSHYLTRLFAANPALAERIGDEASSPFTLAHMQEGFASLPANSEEALKQQLREHAAGKTMIVVTHRTSLLDLVDRIIVVDAGRIVADGPKAQVVDALRQGRIGRAA